MLLRNLQDRATGRRASCGGGDSGGVGTDEGGVDQGLPSSSSPPTSPLTSPSRNLANSLAASADLAPRLRVVATCDGHEGCVNAVSFAGERGERLVTGGDDMTVRIWSSDVSAWEPSSNATSLASRREIARIRTRHISNLFQAFFVDPTDEGSELLTCAADGAVRSMTVPRAQTERLFPSSGGRTPAATAASTSTSTVVENRCLFWHGGRAHKMALVPGSSPCEFATCGEDGIVALFDLRERGRGGGSGIGSSGGGENSAAAPPSPLTAAVGPAALAAAARAPGRSCVPPSDRGCSRATAASASGGSSSNVDVTLYSVSFDPLRPWLLAVGGDASEREHGDRPAAVVIDRRMLSIPPAEALRRRRPAAGPGGSRRGRGRLGGPGRLERRGDDDDGDGDNSNFYSDGEDDQAGPDPAAGTIFARNSLIRQLLDSSRRVGLPPLGTLDAARVRA